MTNVLAFMVRHCETIGGYDELSANELLEIRTNVSNCTAHAALHSVRAIGRSDGAVPWRRPVRGRLRVRRRHHRLAIRLPACDSRVHDATRDPAATRGELRVRRDAREFGSLLGRA